MMVFYAPESPLLLPSLRLFIPPLRLVSAAMWQVIQRGHVQDYGMVDEFITTVSEIVPELLNADQKAELLLGLRARVSLQSGPHAFTAVRKRRANGNKQKEENILKVYYSRWLSRCDHVSDLPADLSTEDG